MKTAVLPVSFGIRTPPDIRNLTLRVPLMKSERIGEPGS